MTTRRHAIRDRLIRLLTGLFVAMLLPTIANADPPIASSSFIGTEGPLSENVAWAALTSLSPQGIRFQKSNGAFADILLDHEGARTTAAVPTLLRSPLSSR